MGAMPAGPESSMDTVRYEVPNQADDVFEGCEIRMMVKRC